MSRLASGALALVAVLVVGACVSVTVTPTAPSGPTRPPTPTQAGPGQTIAPVPTQQAGGNLCDKVTLDEVSAAAGGLPAVLGEDFDLEGECNWDVGVPNDLGTPDAFVNLRVDFSNALDDARELFPGGEDIAVGDDGYWMPDLYVLTFSTGGRIFSVQVAVVDADNVDPRALAIALATTAAPRL